MSSPIENTFRHVEQVLDRLLKEAAVQLDEQGIGATDASAREYHYKNERLFWSYRFESRRPHRGPEIASVTVGITFQEPVDSAHTHFVEFDWRAEIFQIGQVSRWEHTERSAVSLVDLRQRGIADLVCTAVSDGYRTIDGK